MLPSEHITDGVAKGNETVEEEKELPRESTVKYLVGAFASSLKDVNTWAGVVVQYPISNDFASDAALFH